GLSCDARLSKVTVRTDNAAGVVLDNGDEIPASIVVSSLDPRRTFLELVESHHLPADFVADIKRFKFRGSSGKVNIALAGLPTFTCMPDSAGGRLHRGAVSISPNLDYVERAYDDAKYGEFSRRPYMDIVFPSMIDPGMAPPGKHVMSIFVQYAPYHLNGGWTDAKREAFGDAVVNTVESFAPGFKSKILHRQVITPLDIGWVPDAVIRDLGLTGAGLRIETPDPWITAPLPAGGTLELSRDIGRSVEAIRRISPADAAKWPDFCQRMRTLASVLERLYLVPPPDIESNDVRELTRIAGPGLYVRRRGKQTVIDLARILPMSNAELLDDWFESDA